jgi:hypothetical protein
MRFIKGDIIKSGQRVENRGPNQVSQITRPNRRRSRGEFKLKGGPRGCKKALEKNQQQFGQLECEGKRIR